MKKIMFVCHGNICRSPMAKYIFRSLTSEYKIESRATSTEAVGDPLYRPIRKVLDEHNILYDKHVAKQLTKEEFDEYDLILVFDNNNMNNMRRMFGESDKVIFLGEHEIEDPWYTRDFERAYNDTYNACVKLLDKLKSTN